tara:strand:+ start:18827 stop:19636 length:810 start_codon:yes stop_codon:yes gene_type:complete
LKLWNRCSFRGAVVLHFLAIDTVCAVLAWSLLADRLLGSAIHPLSLLWTGAGVWLAYTADRWMDSLPGSTEQNPGERHRFAGRNRNSIALAWLCVWILSLGSAVAILPAGILLGGAVVAILGIAYLLIIQRLPSRDETGKLRAGGGWVVGLLVATAANLFPALEGNASAITKLIVWLLTAWAFFLQTRATRLWEEGESIPRQWLLILTICGAIAATILHEAPAAVAALTLAGGILITDRLPIHDKVAVADWVLAIAGVCGWAVALALLP